MNGPGTNPVPGPLIQSAWPPSPTQPKLGHPIQREGVPPQRMSGPARSTTPGLNRPGCKTSVPKTGSEVHHVLISLPVSGAKPNSRKEKI